MEDCRVEALKIAEDNLNSRILAVTAREDAVSKRENIVKQDISKRVDETIKDTLKYLNVVIFIFIWLIIFIGLKSGFWKSVTDMIENYSEIVKAIYVYWSEPELTFGGCILMIMSESIMFLFAVFIIIFALVGYYPVEHDSGRFKSFYRAVAVGIGAFIVVFGGEQAAMWFIGVGVGLCIIRWIILPRY